MSTAPDTLLTTASLAELEPFHLGRAEACPATRTLSGPLGQIQVEPRVMQVLVVLAETPGAVVTRDRLLARCWGGVFVADESLNRAIGGVRRAATMVGADFEIETIPRTGYRLLVDEPPPPSAVLPFPVRDKPAPAEPPAEPSNPGRRMLLGGGLAALVAAGVGTWRWQSPTASADPVAGLIKDSDIAMRAGSPEGARKAIALLEQAVKVAPANARAWGRLALTRARADEHAIDKLMFPAEGVGIAANRALQLDPNNADAEAALAIAIPYYGDWLGAERRFDRVLARHPGHLPTQDSRAFMLGAVGRMKESARDRLAFTPDDIYDAGVQYRQVYAYWFLDRIEEADRAATRGLEMWPRAPGLWFARLWVLAGTGRFARAIAHIDDAAGRPPLPPPMVQSLRNSMVAAGRRDPVAMKQAAEQLMAGVSQSVAAVVNAMMLLNMLQATDKAFELAEAYYLERGPIIAAMQWRPGQPVVPDQRRRKTNMMFTPLAAPMQKDPRFATLMRNIGMGDYWRRRGVEPDYLS